LARIIRLNGNHVKPIIKEMLKNSKISIKNRFKCNIP